MNKYLEKIASWKNPSKFIGYVTGRHKNEALAKVRHMEEAIANKYTLDDLKGMANHASRETTKARIAGGLGAATIGTAGTYLYKKRREKKMRDLDAQYAALFKQAAVGRAAVDLGKNTGTALGKILKRVGKATVDTMNTAGGGKIKDYAHLHGINVGTKQFEEYRKGSMGKQLSILRAHQGIAKPTDKRFQEHKFHLRNLYSQRRNARIALGSTTAAGISAYGWKKARDAAKKEHPYY